MWLPIAFYPACIATVIFGLLLALLLKTGLKRPGNTAAFMLFLAFFLWSFGEMIERMAGPPPAEEWLALVGVKILTAGVFLVLPAGIHFGWDFPFRLCPTKQNLRKYIIGALYAAAAVAIVLNAATTLFISGVSPYHAVREDIWGMDHTPLYMLYQVGNIAATVFLIASLVYKHVKTHIPVVKKQIRLVLAGFLLSYVLVLATGFIPMVLGMDMYPLTTPSFTLMAGMILYTIVRYRLFIFTPAAEERVEEAEALSPGVYEMGREEAYGKVASLARSGNPALIFTPEDVDEVRERYGLKETLVFQISEKAGRDRLNPAVEEHREMIPFIVMSFITETGGRGVVLMDCLDAAEEIAGADAREWLEEQFRHIEREHRGVYIHVRTTTN